MAVFTSLICIETNCLNIYICHDLRALIDHKFVQFEIDTIVNGHHCKRSRALTVSKLAEWLSSMGAALLLLT